MASRFAQQNYYSNRSNASNNRAASASRIPNDEPTPPGGTKLKVLPIQIMLDVSPSMHENDRIQEQNIAVETFLKSISRNDKIRRVAQISFCLFTRGVKYTTDFMPLTDLRFPASDYLAETCPRTYEYTEEGKHIKYVINNPRFRALQDDGTDIPDAVNTALDNIQSYVRKLNAAGSQHYVPFVVFTSDGNPDLNRYEAADREDYKRRTQEAARRMNAVCNRACDINEMIIPFFIGIGKAEEKYLRSFCEEFQEGVLKARHEGEELVDGVYLTFSNIARAVATGIARSITLTQTSRMLLDTIGAYILLALNPVKR